MFREHSKILIGGDSYAFEKEWPSFVFSKRIKIINLSRPSAGNIFISNSITDYINPSKLPKFVFILWGGVSRIDIRYPKNKLIRQAIGDFKFFGETSESYWLFLGGDWINKTLVESYNKIKDVSWPNVKTLQEIFEASDEIKNELLSSDWVDTIDESNVGLLNLRYIEKMQYLTRNVKYYSEITYQHMVNCFTLLEKYNIPYRFSFASDPFSKHIKYRGPGFSELINKSRYYRHINWNNYVNLTPYEFYVKYELLDDDLYPTMEGQKLWSKKLQKKLIEDKEVRDLNIIST